MDKVVKKNNIESSDEVVSSKLVMSKVVKKNALHISTETMKFGRKVMDQHSHDAQVRLIGNGDKVEAIEVICPCGNKIEILCQYD
ncbi:MAG: hypothetical protein RBU23_10310 [Candidatus Auribacterota bacterium]|jgi:hypothetical protein|nr:hypothetical protein [Candidatus Auribacterota bacterium]